MNQILKWILAVVVIVSFTACDENQSSIGVNIQPQEDHVKVKADTFHLASFDYKIPYISAQSDTMLLGEVFNSDYGTTKSDLLLQFSAPLNVRFPEDSFKPEADSMMLVLAYHTWLGSNVEPLEIKMYEMLPDKIDYIQKYRSDLNPNEFVDFNKLIGTKTVTTTDFTVSDSLRSLNTYLPVIKIKFDKSYAERFFNFDASVYSSTENFLKAFPGIYFTSSFGSSTMFHLAGAEMKLFYHYTYDKNGKDTVVNSSIVYPANKEVRQLAHYSHPDMDEYTPTNDSINYLVSTAGKGIHLDIPVGRMRERIYSQLDDKLMNINMAQLVMEIPSLESNALIKLPQPTFLLAMTESKYDEFVDYNTIPLSSDSTMVMASFNTKDSTYVFDFSYFVTKSLRRNPSDYSEVERAVVVPVNVEVNRSSGQISRIRPMIKTSGIRVRSGKNDYSPMRFKILYNGF